MMTRYINLAIGLLLFTATFSQDNATDTTHKWSLQECVDYALANNISVRQADLQARFSALSVKQRRAAQLPTLGFNMNAGKSYGLSNDPTTGILVDNVFFNTNAQLQSQVTIFNWFALRNAITSDKLFNEADREQTKKIQNDVALNVAVAYLQILLAREQVNVSSIQVQQTMAQLTNTQKQVDAGKLPELNAAQLEAQLAADSSGYITAQANADQFVLQLKALLNLDAGRPFDVQTPPVERIPVESLADLQPETVYASALANLPQQKVNQLRIESAQAAVKVAKAGLYPVISGFGSLSSSYIDPKGVKLPPFGTQFRNNFGQSIGLGLNIPILNGRFARTAWDRSKLDVRNLQLTKELGDQQLKQDIYKAYIDATAAIQKFNSNRTGVQTSQKAYDFAKKRYDLGLLSTYDLLSTQNSLLTAKTQLLYAQYDYLFKIKLLEFYKGQGLKL